MNLFTHHNITIGIIIISILFVILHIVLLIKSKHKLKTAKDEHSQLVKEMDVESIEYVMVDQPVTTSDESPTSSHKIETSDIEHVEVRSEELLPPHQENNTLNLERELRYVEQSTCENIKYETDTAKVLAESISNKISTPDNTPKILPLPSHITTHGMKFWPIVLDGQIGNFRIDRHSGSGYNIIVKI